MNLAKYKYIVLAAAIGTLWSCDDEFENPVEDQQITSGDADFSTYVALGNSLTSGYMDGELFLSGQENSYPNIIAQQMGAAGNSGFAQPLFPDDAGFGNRLELGLTTTCQGNTSASPTLAGDTPNPGNVSGAVQNLGVPGARLVDLSLDPAVTGGIGYASLNPYYGRFASSATATVIGDAIAQNPTFFSLWIGNNDVLGYATSGGVTGNTDCVPSAANSLCTNSITNTAFFAQVLESQLQALTSNGAKGVIANIPNVTSIPFFTTLPYNVLPLDNAQVTALNASQLPALHNGVINAAVAQGLISAEEGAMRQLNYEVSCNNSVLTKDETLTDLTAFMQAVLPTLGVDAQTAAVVSSVFGQARQTHENDLVLLTAASGLGEEVNPANGAPMAGTGFFVGVNYPADQYVLEPHEQQAVADATAAYNTTIRQLATNYNLAFVDANATMAQLSSESGLVYDGVGYSASFVTGGVFSLDGVHPNAVGYAIIANAFIDAINTRFGSNLQTVNPNNYPGLDLSPLGN